MAHPDLGQKLTCVSCSARFYDLQHVPITCPKCGTVQTAPKPRWSQSHRPAGGNRWQQKPAAAPSEAAAAGDEAVEDVDADLETIDPPDDDDDDDDAIEVIPAVEEI